MEMSYKKARQLDNKKQINQNQKEYVKKFFNKKCGRKF